MPRLNKHKNDEKTAKKINVDENACQTNLALCRTL